MFSYEFLQTKDHSYYFNQCFQKIFNKPNYSYGYTFSRAKEQIVVFPYGHFGKAHKSLGLKVKEDQNQRKAI